MNYHDYLKSAHWKKRRIEIFNLYGRICRFCGKNNNLIIHHKRYIRHKNKTSVLFMERDRDLIPLCNKCHGLWHKYHKRTEMITTYTLAYQKLRIYGFTEDECVRFCAFPKIVKQLIKDKKNNGYGLICATI